MVILFYFTYKLNAITYFAEINYPSAQRKKSKIPFITLKYKVYKTRTNPSNVEHNSKIKNALQILINELNELMPCIGNTHNIFKKYKHLRFKLAMCEIMMYEKCGHRHRDDNNVHELSSYDPSAGATFMWNIVVNSEMTEEKMNDGSSETVWLASETIGNKAMCINNIGCGCKDNMYGHLPIKPFDIFIFPNPDIALFAHRAESIGNKIIKFLGSKNNKIKYLTILILMRNLTKKIIDNAPHVPLNNC